MITVDKPEVWGLIPSFLSENDPRHAQEQFDSNYIGGFHIFRGFKLDPETKALSHKGDPDLLPIDHFNFRGETITIYPYAWVMITQPNGSWVVAHMD